MMVNGEVNSASNTGLGYLLAHLVYFRPVGILKRCWIAQIARLHVNVHSTCPADPDQRCLRCCMMARCQVHEHLKHI